MWIGEFSRCLWEEDWEHSFTQQKPCGRMEPLKMGAECGVMGRGVREHNIVFVF